MTDHEDGRGLTVTAPLDVHTVLTGADAEQRVERGRGGGGSSVPREERGGPSPHGDVDSARQARSAHEHACLYAHLGDHLGVEERVRLRSTACAPWCKELERPRDARVGDLNLDGRRRNLGSGSRTYRQWGLSGLRPFWNECSSLAPGDRGS